MAHPFENDYFPRSGSSLFIRPLPITLAQLCIADENQPNFSIYQSEIGSYAIGRALTDTRLFEICRDYGDPSGSLKFFISPYPDRPAPQSQAGFSPVRVSSTE